MDLKLTYDQVAPFVARRKLPSRLVALLQNPHVCKVGRMISGDLKQLEAIAQPTLPFSGGLDLAAYAKARHVVSKANCSLGDLCAKVFGKRLNKNVSERTSIAWENRELTEAQINYAACDAYVSLLLYNELSKFSIPRALSAKPPASAPILLYHTDNTLVIAYGRLSALSNISEIDGIRLSARTVLLEVTEVLVPAAIISTHNKRALKDFGHPPFQLVALRSHVFHFDGLVFGMQSLEPGESTAEGAMKARVQPAAGIVADEGDRDESTGLGDILRNEVQGVDEGEGNLDSESATTIVTAEADVSSQSHGRTELSKVEPPKPEWDKTIRSRVLKDVFHVFNMLRLSTGHGLRKEFSRALRDAIFIPDQEDRVRISAWAATQKPPTTFEQLQAKRPDWLWRHCRRIIPPPSSLFPLVEKTFLTYGPLKDAATGLTLFGLQHWKTAKQILELIRQGFISDPPGIPLYTIICLDSAAGKLPIYRCSRGTNFTEGGVHTHLRSRLPTSGASVRHVNACLSDFVLQHNLRVSNFDII